MRRISVRHLTAVSVAMILAGLSIWQLRTYFSQQYHVLNRRPAWRVTKNFGREPYGGLMGQEFSFERQALADQTLSLGEWHGYQEVTLDREGVVQRMELTFRLDPDAYLWIFFDQDHDFRKGIRLSRNFDFATGYYELDGEGFFVPGKTKILDHLMIGPQWQHFAFERLENSIRIKIDDQPSQTLAEESQHKTTVSLRSGANGTWIGEVSVWADAYSFFDDFSLRSSRNIWALAAAVYLLLLSVFAAKPIWSRMRSGQEMAAPLVTTQLVLILILTSLRIFDGHFWAHQYFEAEMDPGRPVEYSKVLRPIEKWRQQMASGLWWISWLADRNERPLPATVQATLLAEARPDPWPWLKGRQYISPDGSVQLLQDSSSPLPGKTVFILGTSQTWGAGAREFSRAFPARMVRQINQQYPGCGLQAVNISVCGSELRLMLPDYFKRALDWKPFAVILNLSSNDQVDPGEFRQALEELWRFNQDHGIKTLLSKEPQSLASRVILGGSYPNYTEFAFDHHLHLVDSMEQMYDADRAQKGLLWWDIIHLDNAGHVLMGQILANEFGADLCGGRPEIPR